jgi:hypothetical protein
MKLANTANHITDFVDVQTFRSNLISTPAVNSLFQIRTKRRNPIKVFACFQLGDRIDGNQTFVKRTFDNVDVTSMRIVLNGTQQYPEREYNTAFGAANDDYARVYGEFLRCGLKDHDIDQGSIVSFDTFKSLYPIFCFDLSEKEQVLSRPENALIDFYWSTATHAANYYVWIFVESERKVELGATQGQMKLINVIY